ncbi:hypothetical protein ANCDUO_24147, partial [Ancylostoma duodenale]
DQERLQEGDRDPDVPQEDHAEVCREGHDAQGPDPAVEGRAAAQGVQGHVAQDQVADLAVAAGQEESPGGRGEADE